MNVKSMILKGKKAFENGKNAFEKCENAFEKCKKAFEKGKNALEKTGILQNCEIKMIKTLTKQVEKLEISLKNRQEFALRKQENINRNRQFSQNIQAEFGDIEVSDDLRVVIDNNVNRANRMHNAYEAKVDKMNIPPEQKNEIKEHLQKQRDAINLLQVAIANQHLNKSTFETAMENFTNRVQNHTNDFANGESPNIANILHETFEEGDLERQGFFQWLNKKLDMIITPEKFAEKFGDTMKIDEPETNQETRRNKQNETKDNDSKEKSDAITQIISQMEKLQI